MTARVRKRGRGRQKEDRKRKGGETGFSPHERSTTKYLSLGGRALFGYSIDFFEKEVGA